MPVARRSVLAAGLSIGLCCALMNGCGGGTKLRCEEADLSTAPAGMRAVIDTYRTSIPELMRQHRIPGLSIAIVDRDRILWTAGFGNTGDDRKTPVTPDTRFSLQSISKSVTATATMLAVQEGELGLDVPIPTYLPGFTVQSRFEERPQERITLRHLLSCTAGFPHEAPVGNNIDPTSPSFVHHARSISSTWLRFKVGERYGYSNLGFDLAAFVLQTVTGKPFSMYVKERVFDPLGMRNSTADMLVVRGDPGRAIGHRRHFRSVPLEIPMVGAGGVYSTAKDMARFVQFNLNRGTVAGHTLLAPRLIDALHTPTALASDYAMGFAVERKHDSYFLNHNGGGFGFLASMTFYPEYGIGCVVLTNSQDHDNQQVRLTFRILDALIEGKLVSKSTPGHVPPTDEVFRFAAAKVPEPAATAAFGTPYRPEWAKYEGTYRYVLSGWQPRFYVTLAFALGYAGSGSAVTVRHENGHLCVDDEPLEEYRPGLFFAASGEALDFRGAVPTWQSFALRKK